MEGESDPKLGELLVKERHLKEEDLQMALTIQQREKELHGCPQGEILVRMGLLSTSDLETLVSHPDLRKQIGSIAIDKGLISKEQLELCLAKKKPGQLIGEVMIEAGLITPDDLAHLIREQINAPRLGELAVKLDLISEKDLENALKIQRSPRMLGEILCDLYLVAPLDLNYILQKYEKQLELEQVLLDLGYATREQLDLAKEEEKFSSDSLSETLVRKGYMTQEQLQVALSKQWNIPFNDLSGFAYSEQEKAVLVNLISQKFAEKNRVLPISFHKKSLTLAIYDPESIQVLYDLKRMYKTINISCIFLTQERFEELFEVLYSKRLGEAPPDDREKMAHYGEGTDLIELNIEEDIGGEDEETPTYGVHDIEIEELVNFILKYGITNSASDIHIEQDREGVKLRYRIDGILRNTDIGWLNEKAQEHVSAVISRIKIMSNLDIAEKRLPQDGVFRVNFCERGKANRIDIDCRVTTCRAIVGENVTIRILDPRQAQLGLEELNHSPHVLEPLKMFLKSSTGMILVTGPTGSGKSSTLYGAMQYLYDPGIKMITAEDPIEYSFPGIMQTQIQPKINLTFSRLLRSFLWLDPDVILVGEIRDEETAKIAFDAAQRGHLILSTLHTNDSISSVSSLLDLSIDYGQMASSLRCVLAQRLVRRICTSCVQEQAPGEDEWGLLFRRYPTHLRFYKGQGCESCNFTGYRGRTVLSEVFIVDSQIGRAMNRGLDEDGLQKLALEGGMKSMLEDGLLKLQETTLSEITRVIPHAMTKAFRLRNHSQQAADFPIDADTRDAASQKPEDSAPTSFDILDPRADGALVNRMLERYQGLLAMTNGNSSTVDAAHFNEFITSNYNQICEQYGCRRVTFSIANNQGKVEILAIPKP